MGTAWGHILFGLPISWFVRVVTFSLGDKHCYRLLWLQNWPQVHTVHFLKELVAFFWGGCQEQENCWLCTMYWYKCYNSFSWVMHMLQVRDKPVLWNILLRLNRGRQKPLKHSTTGWPSQGKEWKKEERGKG